MENRYDIFISYRRDGGAQYARILQLMLIQRGYKVFLDYDELTDGVFSEKIKVAIKEAPVFMLVLSKGALTRCANEGDWVRKEIELAISQQKHLIPINPDNSFDGIPETIPEQIREAIGSHQHSEISFGQALGATIDLMIKNRLVPTLGERVSNEQKDNDYATAKETLRRQDEHHRFMKRLGIAGVTAVVLIALCTGLWLWKSHRDKTASEEKIAALTTMRSELQEKYGDFHLQLNNNLTEGQMAAIDTLLANMVEVYPDSIWMSQYEFTIGQWYGIKGEPFDEELRHLPMTKVTYGEIVMFLLDLGDFTNLTVALPSAEVWEYAAHGGNYRETTLYVGNDDVDRVAWYKDNSGGHAHPSDGQQGKEPNMLDLYDMSGNVGELCNTPFDKGGRYTVCGGNYDSPAAEVTATARTGIDTNAKLPTVGFRIIIEKP